MLSILKKLIPKGFKRYYHLIWSLAALLRYGNASKRLIIIGVTGTDGKTTTTTLIHAILQAAGKRVAMLNGLRYVLPSKEWKNHSDNSTPGRGAVHAFLRQAADEGCTHVVVEVTSWGLDQYRLFGIAFDVAVITNFTYEHLDLHGSMEAYKQAKGKLFAQLNSARKPGQQKTAVINIDDPAQGYFASFAADRHFFYGLNERAEFIGRRAQAAPLARFDLCRADVCVPVKLQLVGLFNVSNALAAAAACHAVGVSQLDIAKGLASVRGVPGRMEFINEGQSFHVIVDFAHTPNGFTRLFETARALVGDKRVIAVFGATGGRDPGRRPMVGEIAAEMVDFSVLTSEDPRHEDPAAIAKEIEKGLNKKGAQMDRDYVFIKDRAEAIGHALRLAKPGDAVLLCSMGDYDVMYVGDGTVPWSDREAAKQALRSLIV